MSDLIASARNSTVVAEGQYNTVGLPKGGLTPATITAMVGFSKGQGLQMNPNVSAAISKLSTVYITNPALGPQANAAAANLQTLTTNLMKGGPAGLMQKFNQARAHINDSIELKKVTAFCANANLSSFGSGISKMSDLADQGLTSKLGNLTNVGNVFQSAGGLFDLNDMSTFGTPAGLINKLNATKMGNSTGINAALAKAGVDTNRLTDPSYKDQIDKAMSQIKDPKVLAAVGEQFNINPPGGLPQVSSTELTSGLDAAAAANPFSGVPAYSGADASVNTGAQSILGGAPTPVQPAPTPENWAAVNDTKAFGTAKTNSNAGNR